MNRTFKRAISSILAFVMVMSCMMVMNVGTVLAAATTYTFTPDAATFNTAKQKVPAGTTLTFVGGQDSITAQTGCEYMGAAYNSGYGSTYSASVAMRSQSELKKGTKVSDYTENKPVDKDGKATDAGTCIVLNVKKDGYFTAWVAASPNPRQFRIFDNTDNVTSQHWTQTINPESSTTIYKLDTVFLQGDHEYIFYNTGFTGNLFKMEFTPVQSIATTVNVTSDTSVDSFKILTSTGDEVQADGGKYSLEVKAEYTVYAEGYAPYKFTADGADTVNVKLTKLADTKNTVVFYVTAKSKISKVTLTGPTGDKLTDFDFAKSDFYNDETGAKVATGVKLTDQDNTTVTVSTYSEDGKYKLSYVGGKNCQIDAADVYMGSYYPSSGGSRYFYINTPEQGCNVSLELTTTNTDKLDNALHFKDIPFSDSVNDENCDAKNTRTLFGVGGKDKPFTLSSNPKPELGGNNTVIGTDGTVYYVIGLKESENLEDYTSIGLTNDQGSDIEGTSSDTVYEGIDIEGTSFTPEQFGYKYIIGYKFENPSDKSTALNGSQLATKFAIKLTSKAA